MFCNCSAAFAEKSWEIIFGQPLVADIAEFVLNGDPWCVFAIHLPGDVDYRAHGFDDARGCASMRSGGDRS